MNANEQTIIQRIHSAYRENPSSLIEIVVLDEKEDERVLKSLTASGHILSYHYVVRDDDDYWECQVSKKMEETVEITSKSPSQNNTYALNPNNSYASKQARITQGAVVVPFAATSNFTVASSKQEAINNAIQELAQQGKRIIGITDGSLRPVGPLGNMCGEVTLLWESVSGNSY